MSQAIMDRAAAVLANTYKRQPLVITRGQGWQVWDSQGRCYADFVAGIAVCNLGHSHPALAKAVASQAAALWHVSNLYYTVPQIELAEWLTGHSFADKAFFCNSGAEANEAAIKIARKFFKDNGQPQRYTIIAMERSFHGRTMATLSATGQDKVRKGFDPVLEGFSFVPFNDTKALEDKIGQDTCAVLLEPVQGEGGVRCPDPAYLAKVRELCDRTGALLIFDEIQTGIGRTGTLFAHEHFNVTPDIMTLAKGLANGLPIGAMLATDRVAGAFGPGSHATTFGGTPIVTAAALETLKILTEGGVMDQGRETGIYFKKALMDLKVKHRCILEVRGLGLLLGVKLAGDAAPVVDACREKGFLVNAVQDRILRFAPPLIIPTRAIDDLIACLDEVMGKMDGTGV